MSFPTSSSSAATSDKDVVIVAAVRTPLCRSNKGGLVGVPPSALFQAVLQELLIRVPNLDPSSINDICVGNVLMPPSGFAALRMAQLAAGIPQTTSLQTLNRQCASSLQAIASIADSIRSGSIEIGIAAGVESMSLYSMKNIQPPPMEDYTTLPPTALDCLIPMGVTSDTVAHQYHLQRTDLDQLAVASHQKAAAAQAAGKFQSEIVSIQNPITNTIVSADDGIRPSTTPAVLAKLRPAFSPPSGRNGVGVTTAGNSSQTTDGAAAVLLMTRKRAVQLQAPILGVWRSYATVGVPPAIMGVGPAYAIPVALQRANLTTNDIAVYELNEAFASQALWCQNHLQLNPNCVNPNGGAIALGHPLGATGVRLVVSLLYELRRRQHQHNQNNHSGEHRNSSSAPPSPYGVVSMCIGTGMGAAAVLQVEPTSSL